jgi:hypothetical protein
MLGKLLKYELKGAAIFFLPLFAATFLFSLLNGSFINWLFVDGPFRGLLMTASIILIVALAVMLFVITIQRFYKNLLGNEGYLMFTLPVSTHHNILSKLLAATIWTIATLMVITISAHAITGFGSISDLFNNMWRSLTGLYYNESLHPVVILLEWIIAAVVTVSSNILLIYLAMAIGQLANANKFMATVGAYIGIQIVSGILTAIAGAILASFDNGALSRNFDGWMNSLGFAGEMQDILMTANISGIIIGLFCYFITHWLLKRKLNLA